MGNQLPSIYFYIPESDWPGADMPESPDTPWLGFGRGIYCWILQTYLYLKADGFPCQLVGTLPSEGIVVVNRDSLPDNMQLPSPKLLMVCTKAERDPLPCSQIHIIQNPQQNLLPLISFWDNYYIPLWRQPGLITRDPGRGDRVENVAYFGIRRNLTPEFQESSWPEQLKALGLSWNIVSGKSWNDYSNVDVVLGMRTFDRYEYILNQNYISKPATKLYNAWHAGVPAILGCDSAFRAERKSELDYLEVASLSETIAALKRLRDDKQLYQAMVENGRVRAQETEVAKVVSQWRSFLTDIAVPAYERWCSSSRWTQQNLFLRRYMALKIIRMHRQLRSVNVSAMKLLESRTSEKRS